MNNSIPQITANEIEKFFKEGLHFALVDVRTREEFARGHLPNAINLPLGELSSRINELPTKTDTKIFVYCLSGSRSSEAVNYLIEKGFTNAYNITSGLLALRATTIPIINS